MNEENEINENQNYIPPVRGQNMDNKNPIETPVGESVGEVIFIDNALYLGRDILLELPKFPIPHIGKFQLGTNSVNVKPDLISTYYAEIDAEEAGYYLMNLGEEGHYLYAFPTEITSDNTSKAISQPIFSDKTRAYINEAPERNYECLIYLNEGTNNIYVECESTSNKCDINLDYMGEIESIDIKDNDLKKFINCNENYTYSDNGSNEYKNYFDTTFVFSSGKTLNLPNVIAPYVIEGNKEDGETTAKIKFSKYIHTDTIKWYNVEDYVKSVEIDNLDTFRKTTVDYTGFGHTMPEEHTITVTFNDGHTVKIYSSREKESDPLITDDGTPIPMFRGTGTINF